MRMRILEEGDGRADDSELAGEFKEDEPKDEDIIVAGVEECLNDGTRVDGDRSGAVGPMVDRIIVSTATAASAIVTEPDKTVSVGMLRSVLVDGRLHEPLIQDTPKI